MPNIFDYNPQNIHPFPYWKWNKVLPAVYDDSLSQYEILCKLLHVVNNIIESTNSTGEQVEQLTQLVQQLIDGEFPSGLVQYVEDIAEAAIADDVDAINDAIDQLRDDIEEEISGLSSIKSEIVVLGDSLSIYSYNAATDATITSGAELWTKIHNTTGYNIHNYAVGGAGFYYTGYTNQTISAQLSTAIADTSYNEKNVKCVIAFAGTNDYNNVSVSNLQNAIASLCTAYNNSRFKNVPFYIVFNQAGYGWHTDRIMDAMFRGYITADGTNIQFFNGSSIMRGYDFICSDDVHPNSYGYSALAKALCKLITCGTIFTDHNIIFNSAIDNNKITCPSSRAFIKDGILYYVATINLLSGLTIANNTLIPISSIPNVGNAMANGIRSWKITQSAQQKANSDAANLILSATVTQSGNDGIINIITNGIGTTPLTLDIQLILTFEFVL